MNRSKYTSDNSASKKVHVNSFRIDFTPSSKHTDPNMRNPGFSATMKPIVKKHKRPSASIGGRTRHNTTRRSKKGTISKKKKVRFSKRRRTVKK